VPPVVLISQSSPYRKAVPMEKPLDSKQTVTFRANSLESWRDLGQSVVAKLFGVDPGNAQNLAHLLNTRQRRDIPIRVAAQHPVIENGLNRVEKIQTGIAALINKEEHVNSRN
jgi:hypothetical protein